MHGPYTKHSKSCFPHIVPEKPHATPSQIPATSSAASLLAAGEGTAATSLFTALPAPPEARLPIMVARWNHDTGGWSERQASSRPAARRILRAGEFWLQSEIAQNSFDSRIVGPVSAKSILDWRVFVIGLALLFWLILTLVAGATFRRRPRPSSGVVS